MTKIKPVDANVKFLYHLETSENHRFFMFLGSTKGNIDAKWVKLSRAIISSRATQFDVVNVRR